MNPKDFIKIHENNVDDPLVIIYKEAPNTSKPQVNDFMDYLEEISKKKRLPYYHRPFRYKTAQC